MPGPKARHLLALGDNVGSMKHTWEPSQDAQDDVDYQVHADSLGHQDGKRREDDGNDVGDDL